MIVFGLIAGLPFLYGNWRFMIVWGVRSWRWRGGDSFEIIPFAAIVS
jgi:hypothetical protein